MGKWKLKRKELVGKQKRIKFDFKGGEKGEIEKRKGQREKKRKKRKHIF